MSSDRSDGNSGNNENGVARELVLEQEVIDIGQTLEDKKVIRRQKSK